MEESALVMGIIIAPTTEGFEDLRTSHMWKYLEQYLTYQKLFSVSSSYTLSDS